MCATARAAWARPSSRPRRSVAFAHGMRRFRRRREVHDGREIGRTEERHRVEVGVAGAQAEVQHLSVVTFARAAGRADDVARARPSRRAARRPTRGTSTTCAGCPRARSRRGGFRQPCPRTTRHPDRPRQPACRGSQRGRRRDGRRRNATRARRTGGRPRREPAGPIRRAVAARAGAGTSSATTIDETRTNLRTFPPGVHEDDSGKEEGRPGNLAPPCDRSERCVGDPHKMWVRDAPANHTADAALMAEPGARPHSCDFDGKRWGVAT